MRAGTLRHQITIQQRSSSRDTFGEEQNSWSTVATLRASVMAVGSRELIRGEAVNNEITHTARIRKPEGVSLLPEMRVSWDGRLFRILGIEPLGNIHRDWELRLAEGWDGN